MSNAFDVEETVPAKKKPQSFVIGNFTIDYIHSGALGTESG